MDEARVGQQGTLTRVWTLRGTRPRAVRDHRRTSVYLFGAVCPERGIGAARRCALSGRSAAPRGPAIEDALLGFDPRPDTLARDRDQAFWTAHLRAALAERFSQAPGIAAEALRAWPADPELLLLAALTALAGGLPERALVLLKRYGPSKPATLLTGLVLAQQGQSARRRCQVGEVGSEMAAYIA